MSILTSGPKNDSVLQAIEFLSNIRTFLYPKNLILLGAGASIRYIDNKPNLKKELNNILDENFDNPRIKNQVNKNELKKSEIARFKLQDFNIELHKTVEGELLINDSEDNLYDKFYIRYPMLLPLYALKKFTLDKNKKPCICPE